MNKQPIQTILDKAKVEGDLTIGDISQVINFVNNTPINDWQPQDIPFNFPLSNTVKFVGRANTLQDLHSQLKESNRVAITAIKGMGGIGKTELAVQYSLLHLLLQSYSGGICWLNAQKSDVVSDIVYFARIKLGIKLPEDSKDWSLQQQVNYCWTRWQDKWQDQKILVIFDGVEDYRQIKDYLPPQPSDFKVIITTRLNLDATQIQPLSLKVLDEESALELLGELIGEGKVNQQLDDAREICRRLGCLPLALNLVGRYIRKYRISLAEMLKRLESEGLSQDALRVNPDDFTRTDDLERGVEAAFNLSWQRLKGESQTLACLLSLFALTPIPKTLRAETVKVFNQSQTSGWRRCLSHWLQRLLPKKIYHPRQFKVTDLEKAGIELEDLHLVQGNDANDYLLHPLIRDFFQGQLNQSPAMKRMKRSYTQVMVSKAQDIPPTPTLQQINTFKPIIPHIEEVANHLTQWLREEDEEIVWIFTGLGWFQSGQGFYQLALPWRKKCVTITKERLGDEHPDVATSLNNLAGLYDSQGFTILKGNMNRQSHYTRMP